MGLFTISSADSLTRQRTPGAGQSLERLERGWSWSVFFLQSCRALWRDISRAANISAALAALCCLGCPLLVQASNVSLRHADAHSLSATIWPDVTEIGTKQDIYLAAEWNGQLYFRDRLEWKRYAGGPFPVAIQGQRLTAVTEVEVAAGVDFASLVGLSVYVGYGASQADMMASFERKVGKVYTVPATDAPFAQPLKIRSGGRYSGRWQSDDPKVPVVEVMTTEPVLIENCVVRGRGYLIVSYVEGARITVNNCVGYGLDPMLRGASRGNFLYTYQAASVVATNNRLTGVSFGFLIQNPTVQHRDGPIIVRGNQGRNLDGAHSDGTGGRIIVGLEQDQDDGNHFIQLVRYNAVEGVDIAWNEFVAEPGISSVGDAISIYDTSGTVRSPLQVRNNLIFGLYPADLSKAEQFDASGITMDGWAGDTAGTATAFVRIFGNVIVAQAFAGIGLTTGHDNEAYNNRIVAAGYLADGTWIARLGRPALTIWAAYRQGEAVYFNNVAYDNVMGVVFRYKDASGAYIAPSSRYEVFGPNCAIAVATGSSRCTGNLSLPDPITPDTEANELRRWLERVGEANVSLGPT